MIGRFFKIAETIKKERYTSYARICVYMNIVEPIPNIVELEYHEEVWQQILDYEHILFICRRCHEYRHLFKECPLNIEEGENMNKQQRKNQEDKEGFQEIKSKRRQVRENTNRGWGWGGEQQAQPSRTNSFDMLQGE